MCRGGPERGSGYLGLLTTLGIYFPPRCEGADPRVIEIVFEKVGAIKRAVMVPRKGSPIQSLECTTNDVILYSPPRVKPSHFSIVRDVYDYNAKAWQVFETQERPIKALAG